MSQVSRTQLAIKFWSEQSQRALAELQEVMGRLAQSQMETEILRAELDAHRTQAIVGQENIEADELRAELAAAAQANERMSTQLEGLTAEWQKQNETLMKLSLDNQRLRVAVGEELVVVVPQAKPRKEPKKKEPIIRNCKKCTTQFEVTFLNRLYCCDACAPLMADGHPRRVAIRKRKGKVA